MVGLLQQTGVRRIVADQCQFGQQTDSEEPLKKPTGFMSNASEILRILDVRCFGKGGLSSRKGGRHAECLGKKAQRAAIFQDELCLAILRGLKCQLIADRRMRHGDVGVVLNAEGIMMDGTDEVNLARYDETEHSGSGLDKSKPIRTCHIGRHASCSHASTLPTLRTDTRKGHSGPGR